MNFENFKNDSRQEDIIETKKSIEGKREVPQSVKYALIALLGYVGGKGIERQIDQTIEIIDALKQNNSLVESADTSFGADPDFVNRVDTDFEYQESLKLVDEILAREDSDMSPENIDKLQQVRQTLSESLEVVDEVLSNVDKN
jgi:hypothetical protein